MKLKLIILTKSAKHGHCVAGIDMKTEEFIRLVGSREGGPLYDRHLLTEEGLTAKELDIIEVDCTPAPLQHQPENYLINNDILIKKLDTYTLEDLEKLPQDTFMHPILKDNTIYLWEEQRIQNPSSLAFIKATDLEFTKDEKNKTKVTFNIKSRKYEKFHVTDRDYFDKLPAKIKEAFMVLSLPNDFPSNKFVAKIFPI